MTIATTDFAAIQARHELDVFGKRGITLVRGEGAMLYDDRGRAYIDCIGGQGSANLGHGHPAIVAALATQAETLMTCPGSFANDQRALLMQELAHLAPNGLDRVFLCNSGTEAVEAALKFARISTERSKIIAAKRGFHGRTFGAMTATHNPKYALGCGPLVPDFHHVAFNQIGELELLLNEDVAAVVLEVVQGEGGVIPANPDYLPAVRKLCDRYGALLIIDEVQTGFCRTGRMFAIEHSGVIPDMLCLAKSIAAGFPMGAVLANQKIDIKVGQHGTTFGGNPLACAASRATLRVMQQQDLATASQNQGNRISGAIRLADPLCVREIRQLGLMIGIELKTRVRPILEQLATRGVLALPAGNKVLRLLPPLVITDEQTDRLIEILLDVLLGFRPGQ